MSKLVTDLISTIKLEASIPDSQIVIAGADFLTLLNNEMIDTVLPVVNRYMENFFVVEEDVALQSGTTDLYPTGIVPIPKRAYARSLRELKFIDSSSNLYNIPQVAYEDQDVSTYTNTSSSLIPVGFCFINDSIRLFGNPAEFAGSLRFSYVIKPNTLVDVGPSALITDIAYAVATLTITANTTATIAPFTLTGNGLFDIIRISTGAIVKAGVLFAVAGSGASTTFKTTTFNADFSNGLQEGGFAVASPYESELCLVPAGKSPYSTLPEIADNLLINAVKGKYFEAQGDIDSLKLNKALRDEIEKNMTSVIGNRITGEPKKVVSRRGIGSWSGMRGR